MSAIRASLTVLYAGLAVLAILNVHPLYAALAGLGCGFFLCATFVDFEKLKIEAHLSGTEKGTK